MHPAYDYQRQLTRRHFFSRTSTGLGVAALASLLGESYAAENKPAVGESAAKAAAKPASIPGLPGLPHFAAKAKRVIYLFQSGAPSQLDLFDHKPAMAERRGEELPDSIRKGQRLTGMTSSQASFPVAPTKYKFAQHGQSGAWLSELLPNTARIADKLCFVKSMHTEAINHDPAITFFQTGAQLAGRPSIGSWLSYGLGSENADLPAFVAMVSVGTGNPNDQPPGRDQKQMFDRVEEDSRCPEDVTCITAGNARLAFSFRRGSDAASRIELNTGRPPRDTVVGSYRITLHGLAPVPNSRRTIDSGAYIATVSVLPG